MPRPRIKALLLLLVLLLGLAAATAILWYRSYDTNRNDRLRFGANYSIRSYCGSLILYVPPPSNPGSVRVEQTLKQLSNDDAQWSAYVRWNRTGQQVIQPWQDSLIESALPALTLQNAPSASLKRPLLDALEDPQRFAVAHAWLAQRFPNPAAPSSGSRDGDRLILDYYGFKYELRAPWVPQVANPNAEYTVRGDHANTLIDRDQIPTLRRIWHDRLAVRSGAIRHSTLVTVFALASLFFAALLVHGLRQRKIFRRVGQNLCPNCGYDLRASPNQCPECGTPRPALI